MVCAHALIARAFHGPPPTPDHEVRHLNGDPLDNHAENLRWGTVAENAADTIRHHRSTRGERNAAAKLTWELAARIRQLHAAGVTQLRLADQFHVSQATVSDLVLNKTWRPFAS